MPLIKRASKRDIPSVFENPSSNSTMVYVEGEGYNKTTLAPVFNSSMYMYYGQPSTYIFTGANLYRPTNVETYNFRSGDSGFSMLLTKETAYCSQTSLTRGSNQRPTNVSWMNKLSMDPNVISSPLRKITDSSNNNLVVWTAKSDFANWYRQIAWYNPTAEFHAINPTISWGSDGQNGGDELSVPIMPTVKETSSNWVSIITNRARYDNICRPMWGLGRNNFYSYDSSNQTYNTTERDGWIVQYIGQSAVDGKPIYLYNIYTNDYQQYITKHNVSNNNTTDLHYFSNTPTANGTNAGGIRSTSSFQNQIKWSSTTFEDPTSAGNLCWYTPYFDTSLNFHPFFYQWNRSTDVFTRTLANTITGDLSSTHMSGLYGGDGTLSNNAGNIEIDTFVNGGNRYLTVIPVHGAYGVYDALPNARKIITYLVNPSNPRALTHHSACQVPTTIRNTLFLNDAKTILGVIGTDVFYVYTWSNDSGWSLSSTIAEKFTAVGRDSTDRIWATAVRADATYADVHVLTTAIPIRITITPASATYNYTGTVINSTVNVSAYNISGQRIAANVALSISGSTMTFSDDSTAVTVTTSTSAEVSQGIKITGAGQSDIVSTVSI